MPYLRLYSEDLPIDQKRVVAQKLIEVTLHSLHLRTDQRNQITIQFIPLPAQNGMAHFLGGIPRSPEFTLEVIGHNLTEGRKKAFAEEAATLFAHLLPVRAISRIASLLGLKARESRRIDFQFSELSPAISEPFLVTQEPWAA